MTEEFRNLCREMVVNSVESNAFLKIGQAVEAIRRSALSRFGGMSVYARKKLVIVGDGACGKTSLLIRFCRDEFNDGYVPTVFETYVADMTVHNKTVYFNPFCLLQYDCLYLLMNVADIRELFTS